jgi:putative phosphoribosyl transferase
VFVNRSDAGRRLAERLIHLRGLPVVVLGLPRGGVPVAAEVAAVLGAPLDVIVVRKLGVPYQRELAMGAIAEDDVRVLNEEIVAAARVTDAELAQVETEERAELARRAAAFRGPRHRVPLEGMTVIVVDDGLATGATARAACVSAHRRGAARVVLAVPVAPRGWEHQLAGVADELVCVDAPAHFGSVGEFYRNFSQTTDAEVVAALGRPPTERPGPPR